MVAGKTKGEAMNWLRAKQHFQEARRNLQGCVDELEPEVASTKGKLAKVLRANLYVCKLLIAVIDALPG